MGAAPPLPLTQQPFSRTDLLPNTRPLSPLFSHYALLMCCFMGQGITVEVGRAHFETEKKRYTVLDAPGHKNYVPNMIQVGAYDMETHEASAHAVVGMGGRGWLEGAAAMCPT